VTTAKVLHAGYIFLREHMASTTADDPFDTFGDSDTEDDHEVSQIADSLVERANKQIHNL
jgi:hypothetical protein